MGLLSSLKAALPRRFKDAVKRALRGGVRVEDRVCVVRGLPITLGVSSEIERYRADTYADKEPETLDWLDANLRAGDVLYDVGANIGVYSLYAAKRRASCRVYAFEPAGQNFARLMRNVSLNGLENVVPCNMPLSDARSFALFYVSDLEAGSAFHNLGAENPGKRSAGPSLRQGALAVSIDELVAECGLPAPTLIKLDVDGLEDKIVAGAAKTLRSPSLRGVLVEATRRPGASSDPVEAALADAGFKKTGSGPEIRAADGSVNVNLIYAR